MNSVMKKLQQAGWRSVTDSSVNGQNAVREVVNISYPSNAFANGFEDSDGFWTKHRADAIRREMRRHQIVDLMEVGAGTGAVSLQLMNSGFDVVALEPIREGFDLAVQRGVPALHARLEELKLPDSSVSTLGCFDVLEHIQDTKPLLKEMFRVLEPGGTLLVTVPCGEWLWGEIDELLGHQRRYSRRRLTRELKDAGFVVNRVRYLFASFVPVAFITRVLFPRLRKRSRTKVSLESVRLQLKPNLFLLLPIRLLLSLENSVSRLVPLPYGLSILGVFKKPE